MILPASGCTRVLCLIHIVILGDSDKSGLFHLPTRKVALLPHLLVPGIGFTRPSRFRGWGIVYHHTMSLAGVEIGVRKRDSATPFLTRAYVFYQRYVLNHPGSYNTSIHLTPVGLAWNCNVGPPWFVHSVLSHGLNTQSEVANPRR